MKLRNDFNNRRIRRKLNFQTGGKRSGECDDYTRFLSPHPPGAQFSLGGANVAHRADVASNFLKTSRLLSLRFFSNIVTFNRDSLNN